MALETCTVQTDRQGRELKRHGTPPFPISCYADDLAAAAVPWHWHDELEAAIVEAGTAVVGVDGEHFEAPRGSGFFIGAGALHGVWQASKADCRLHSIVFHPRLIGGSMDSVFWERYLQPLSAAAKRGVLLDAAATRGREMLDAVDSAWSACVAEEPGYEFAARAALSRLIFLLAEQRPSFGRGPSAKALREEERIKAMLQYIREHFGEELSVAQIARSALISESECLRCFRNIIGVTPIQYLRHFRVERAAELLVSSEEKIADIAARCGFQEMSYFSRVFRETKGHAPGDYRRRKRA